MHLEKPPDSNGTNTICNLHIDSNFRTTEIDTVRCGACLRLYQKEKHIRVLELQADLKKAVENEKAIEVIERNRTHDAIMHATYLTYNADWLPPEGTYFIFTFGTGHVYKSTYVRIWAEGSGQARKRMVEHYGQQWSMEYEKGKEPQLEQYNMRWLGDYDRGFPGEVVLATDRKEEEDAV